MDQITSATFIRKSHAHEHVGLSRGGLYKRIMACKSAGLPVPPLRRHKVMDLSGYKYSELMDWWYEQETELVG